MTGGQRGDEVRRRLEALLPGVVVADDAHGDAVRVLPGGAEEASEFFRIASAHGWPVRVTGPRPGGGVGGQDASGEVAVVVGSDRLGEVGDYEPADLTITAGSGFLLRELDALTRDRGQWLPLDPPGWWRHSLGGLVAGGAAGPLRAGFGTVRDHLLGATVVTGDGRRLELGGRVVKNVAGFDLLKLLVGSRGTLGLLVSATFRLHPLPQADRTLLWSQPVDGLAGAARRLTLLPAPVAALEWLGPGIPGVTGGEAEGGDGPLLALRVTGGPAEVDAICRGAEAAAGSRASRVYEGAASSEFFRRLSGLEAAPGRWGVRLAVLPSLLPELLGRLSTATGEEEAWLMTHVTAGIVRIYRPEGHAGAGLQEVVRWVRSRGGSVRAPGVRGIEPPPVEERVSALEEGIRAVFDPEGVLVGPREGGA